jgi:hypothetical protein
MIQKLIVEGDNDIHLITRLCLKKGIKNIQHYENESEYKLRFVTNAGGKEEAKKALKIVLDKEKDPQSNIGIVVDADSETDNPAIDTWLSIKNILNEFGYTDLENEPNPTGTIIVQDNKPKVGVWIMPDNLNEGYIEHFFQKLIIEGDEHWIEANTITENFVNEGRNRFSTTALQKAKVHTWLSWQEKPELPMGLALKDYNTLFDLEIELIQNFYNWFINTFDVNLK